MKGIKGWISDLGFALRVMARKPQASLMLIATLVLGISVTTAMFSVLDAVLLRPLPFVDSERVVILGAGLLDLDYWNISHTFEHLASYYSGGVNLVANGVAMRAQTAEVSPDYFSVFGAAPIAGAPFGVNETIPGRNHVAILSHALWKQYFAGSLDALGATIRINGVPYTVNGIMPAKFAIPGDTALWVPMAKDLSGPRLVSGEQISFPISMTQRVVGRLREGVTLAQARAEIEALRQRMVEKFAGTNRRFAPEIQVAPYTERLVGDFRTGLLLLFLAATMVLLIACANAGGLLFARGAMRRRELAVRMSLGASRWRIVRQLLAESAVIATASSVGAIALSAVLIRTIRVFGPAEVPRLAGVTLNLRSLGFAIVVSQSTGIMAGFWPAIRSSALQILPALQSAGPGARADFSGKLRRILIVAEIASAMALTCSAGVALRSLYNLLNVNFGFAKEHILTLRLVPPQPPVSAELTGGSTGAPQTAQIANAMAIRRTMLDAVQSIPGVTYAAETSELPLKRMWTYGFYIDTRNRIRAASAHENDVYGDYFSALSLPLLAGRTFDERDGTSSPRVCVVSAKLAEEFGGVLQAIGQQLKLEGPGTVWQIVGVVADSRTSTLDRAPEPELYTPAAQNVWGRPYFEVALILRTAGDPQAISNEVTQRLRKVFTDAPPFQVETLDLVISDSVAQPRFRGELLGGFAALGMALALAGIYGVIAFSVAARTHEIGIRLALGAERSRILRMVLAEGLKLGVAGIVLGIGVAWSLKQYLATLVFGVKALDPVTIAAAAMMLLGVALLACAVPARRASRVDPVIALRYE